LEKEGEIFDQVSLKDRMEKARFWLEEYNPDAKITLKTEPDMEYFTSCEPEYQDMIKKLYTYLRDNPEADLKDMETQIYDIPKKP
jgi:lysyl-tRNA synthetase class I